MAKILQLHFFVCCVVFGVAVGVCYIWYAVLSRPSTIEDEFRHSETLQLLQIIIGFTYLGVIQSFFNSLQEKTALTAELCTLFDDTEDYLPDAFVDKLIGVESRGKTTTYAGMYGAKTSTTDSWSHWDVPDKYKSIFTRVVVADNSDHGQLFSFLGPWFAIGVFYLFHPPVAYREDGSVIGWVLIYSVSISILFSFLLTMWIVERAVDFGFLSRGGCFYDCTLQSYMETKTNHMRQSRRPYEAKPYVGRSTGTIVRRGDLLL